MRNIFVYFYFIIFTSSAFCQTDSLASGGTASSCDKEIFVSGGLVYPYLPSEFNDFWKSGLNANIGFGFSFTPGDIGYSSLIATIDYSKFNFNELKYRESINKNNPDTIVSGSPAKSFTFSLSYKGTFSTTKKSIAPYFLIGFGYMFYDTDSVTVNHRMTLSPNDANTSAFTWSVGIGVEIPIGNLLAGYIQARSVLGAFDRPIQYFPLNAGIRVRF